MSKNVIQAGSKVSLNIAVIRRDDGKLFTRSELAAIRDAAVDRYAAVMGIPLATVAGVTALSPVRDTAVIGIVCAQGSALSTWFPANTTMFASLLTNGVSAEQVTLKTGVRPANIRTVTSRFDTNEVFGVSTGDKTFVDLFMSSIVVPRMQHDGLTNFADYTLSRLGITDGAVIPTTTVAQAVARLSAIEAVVKMLTGLTAGASATISALQTSVAELTATLAEETAENETLSASVAQLNADLTAATAALQPIFNAIDSVAAVSDRDGDGDVTSGDAV